MSSSNNPVHKLISVEHLELELQHPAGLSLMRYKASAEL
ncbi:hypothetical protein T11_5987 [Trichinella zimbabwensis]|uniref:Uncharacterized protein n=1 Tax=Trichinella zimbabwensis TaxID=268475 RepID=A0A0V1GJC2_9BILA|nr:hypothetical protein T11_5987 [Trichinella zimbabwensis]